MVINSRRGYQDRVWSSMVGVVIKGVVIKGWQGVTKKNRRGVITERGSVVKILLPIVSLP